MAWEPVDLRNNEGMKPLVVGIVSIVFATAAVAFRFYSHRIMKSSYVLDDWMIIVALVDKPLEDTVCVCSSDSHNLGVRAWKHCRPHYRYKRLRNLQVHC